MRKPILDNYIKTWHAKLQLSTSNGLSASDDTHIHTERKQRKPFNILLQMWTCEKFGSYNIGEVKKGGFQQK